MAKRQLIIGLLCLCGFPLTLWAAESGYTVKIDSTEDTGIKVPTKIEVKFEGKVLSASCKIQERMNERTVVMLPFIGDGAEKAGSDRIENYVFNFAECTFDKSGTPLADVSMSASNREEEDAIYQRRPDYQLFSCENGAIEKSNYNIYLDTTVETTLSVGDGAPKKGLYWLRVYYPSNDNWLNKNVNLGDNISLEVNYK